MIEDYNGVIGIVFRRGNPDMFVLIRNQGTGNITFPAGGREMGETSSRQTLEREIREETGLQPSEYWIIETSLIHEFIYNKRKKERKGLKARQSVYLIETEKMDLHPEDPDSIIDGWYTSSEVIERLTFADSKELFKKAIKFLYNYN
ncbi:MAG: NUDIX domain-containing protein [Nanoarchaeota archaeon]|nr:NUDIX domain-containing protein [Nanoarchaeota archaeon]